MGVFDDILSGTFKPQTQTAVLDKEPEEEPTSVGQVLEQAQVDFFKPSDNVFDIEPSPFGSIADSDPQTPDLESEKVIQKGLVDKRSEIVGKLAGENGSTTLSPRVLVFTRISPQAHQSLPWQRRAKHSSQHHQTDFRKQTQSLVLIGFCQA